MPGPVYRGLTAEELDAQYNLRAQVPEHPRFFAAYQADSEAVRARLPARLDLAYGSHPRQRLDIFPAAATPAPALVFIHGGYWQAFGREHHAFPAPAFVDSGIAYVALSYGLCPEVTMTELAGHVREALLWLHDHGAEHGVDPDRLYVAGHSAGGHLTALLAATDWAALGRPAGLVRGGCALSGLYDLEPIRLCYLNRVLGMDAAEAARLSPLHRLRDDGPPLILAVGGRESAEMRRQTASYAAARRARRLPTIEVAMPEHHHFDIVQALGQPDDPLFLSLRSLILEG